MKTFYPTKPFNIALKAPETRKNDHEDRMTIAFASDYMPPIPKFTRIRKIPFTKASLHIFKREVKGFFKP